MKKVKLKLALLILAFAFSCVLSGCKEKKCELSFETNGGNAISAVSLKEGSQYDLPTPSREGYEFSGWFLNSDLSGEAVLKVTVSSDTKVYAKWEELYAITLNANGGTLSQTTVYGKAGDSILSLVDGLTPSKSGLKFGGWFINGTEVSSQNKLTSKGATLEARYMAEYTIKTFEQKIDKSGYEEKETKAYEYIGKKVEANTDVEGFFSVETDDTIEEITIGEDSKNNVLKVYLDRYTYTITFRSNYNLEDVEDDSLRVEVVYGEEITLPKVDFALEGAYLLGWSLSADGEIIYDAHFIDNLAINRDGDVEVEEIKITTNRTISLYAIWNKGYADMFGGSDYIFMTEEEGKIYMCRGGKYFQGELFEDNSFIFYNDYENLEGVIYENETFAYYNSDRSEYSASLYEVGKGLNENVKILFDAYNGITYSVVDEAGTVNLSKGTYTINEYGYYVCDFTEGDLEGTTLTIITGKVTMNGAKQDAFQVRNEKEFNYGWLVRFGVYEGKVSYYQAYQMLLSGFGTLYYNTGSGYSTYYYTFDPETMKLSLSNSNGQSMGTAIVQEIEGQWGYIMYDESNDKTYEAKNGDKLSLDGLLTATYIHDGETITGYYTLSTSVFGGYIVKFQSNGVSYTFLTSTESETIMGEEGKNETITKDVFEAKPEGYAEYYYKDENGYYYAPLVVINDKEVGKASIYGYTQSKTYKLILEGTWSYDEATKLYTFVKETVYEEEVITSPLDISKVEKVVMSLDTSSTKYSINYWHTAIIDGTEKNFVVRYTSADGSTLEIASGMATIRKDGAVVTGEAATKNGITTITNTSGSVYVELDNETLTFITLDHAPYSAYVVTEEGKYSNNEYVALDGKGGAVYTYYVTEVVEEEETSVKKEIIGSVVKTENTTKAGYVIYQFQSEEKSFRYIVYSNGTYVFLFPEYGTYGGSYASDDGILYLDGFGFYASYTDPEGTESTGVYTIIEENVIRIGLDDMYRYFDINGEAFTIRGKEYGTYILMDNQGAPGLYLHLNGYGKLEIFKYEKNEEGESNKVEIDENGSYAIDGETFTLTYKDGIKDVTQIGILSTYTYGSNTYNTFVLKHEEVVMTFINNKDWSILKLDSVGNGTLIDNKGNVDNGTYMLITDSLLYYMNGEKTNANIYKYNMEKGTIVVSEFTARGYYTKDLKSLLFSQYGFAIFEGTTRYYYAMEGNDVIIYHQDAESEDANEYGFVRENFGEFDDIKEYGGETYYSNDGYAITFSRIEETKDNYPVLVTENNKKPLEELTFTPSGTDEFSVSGSIKIDGTSYDCTVIRGLEDGEYKMYISIGYYMFEINAIYQGKDLEGTSIATYEIIDMQYIRSFYPYTYLNTYYYIYMFYGSTYANMYTNNFGMFHMVGQYDKEGEIVSDTFKAEFYDGTDALDLNGTLLGAEAAEYERNEKTGLYSLELTATDGYTYKLYFQLKNHSAFNLYGYQVYAVTRVEKLTYGDYSLEIERIIFTEANYSLGTIFSITLYNGEEELEYAQLYAPNDDLYYVVRTYDEETGLITSTIYYEISLKAKDAQIGEEEEESTVVQPYESMTVKAVEATTYYTEDGKNFIDVVGEDVRMISLGANKYRASETVYDAETKTYTITLSSGDKYTCQVGENNKVTITKVIEEPTESEE